MTRRRKIGVACALLLLAFVVVARPILFRKTLDVVSIKTERAYQDAALLERAWRLPVAAEYQKAQLVFQPNGSICGPTSLANVFRSLSLPAKTPDAVLDGTGKCSLFGICVMGLTLDELADVARHQPGRSVTVLRDLDLAAFRGELAHVNDVARRYVVNFDRGPLFGPVGGHHSPIGGYLQPDGLVLVLDVNEKYHPWLVSSERLFRAMDTLDGSSGKKRGLLLIQ